MNIVPLNKNIILKPVEEKNNTDFFQNENEEAALTEYEVVALPEKNEMNLSVGDIVMADKKNLKFKVIDSIKCYVGDPEHVYIKKT